MVRADARVASNRIRCSELASRRPRGWLGPDRKLSDVTPAHPHGPRTSVWGSHRGRQGTSPAQGRMKGSSPGPPGPPKASAWRWTVSGGSPDRGQTRPAVPGSKIRQAGDLVLRSSGSRHRFPAGRGVRAESTSPRRSGMSAAPSVKGIWSRRRERGRPHGPGHAGSDSRRFFFEWPGPHPEASRAGSAAGVEPPRLCGERESGKAWLFSTRCARFIMLGGGRRNRCQASRLQVVHRVFEPQRLKFRLGSAEADS